MKDEIPCIYSCKDLVFYGVQMEIVTFPDDLQENCCHFQSKQKIAHSSFEYRKSSIRSRPCIILNSKFPRLVLEVQSNPDLVTFKIVKKPDLVNILLLTDFLLIKNLQNSEILAFLELLKTSI